MQRQRWFVFVLVGFVLLLVTLILSDMWPGLRGPAPDTSEWHWPYELRPFARWWPALLSSALLLSFAVWWLRATGESRWPLVILSILTLTLQLSLIYADRPNIGAELVDRTLSTESNGYFAAAAELADLNVALQTYPVLMDRFQSEHARTHPPGLVVANWLTIHALGNTPRLTDWLAEPARLARCTDLWVLSRPPDVSAALWLWSWLPPVAAALIAFPAYLAGHRLYHGQLLTVRFGTFLAATLPALLVFSPTTDQLYALLATLSFLWLLIGLQDSQPIFLFLSGLTVSLMTFSSLGNAAWALLLVLYLLLSSWLRLNGSRQSLLLELGVFGMAAVSLWLIYWLGWGIPPWAIAFEGLEQHYTLVTSLRRYDWWVGYNLLDFLLFAGPLVAIGLIGQAITAVRVIRHDEALLALLLVSLLILLDLSGSTRGEVGRLWLPFMPLAAILAAGFLTQQNASASSTLPSRRFLFDRLGAGFIFLLATPLFLTLAIGFGWKPVLPVILPIPPRPEANENQPSTTIDIQLIHLNDPTRPIQLRGFDLPLATLQAGQTVNITLYWTAARPTVQPYTVFTHLIDSSGNLVAQQDNWPLQGQWPSTCWQPHMIIADDYAIQLPPDLTTGSYSLLTGMYDPTGVRLQTADGQDYVRLGEIIITTPSHE